MSFRFLTRLGATLLVAASGAMAAHAATAPYSQIVVFGDSYNDVGNIHALAAAHGIDYPPAPYYQGRFSNGPIWIEHVAASFGLPMLPSAAPGGTDFAVGGAELLQPVTLVPGLTIPSIEDQVAYYLAINGGHADPNALYVIEGGGNDILHATGGSPQQLGDAIADGIFGIEQSLLDAGATQFLIPDLINVGELPAAAAGGLAAVKFAHAAALEANQKLEVLLTPVPGILFNRIHVYQTFLGVADDPTHFGFVNVTDPCLTTSGLTVVSECSDPDHSLWWDAEHPSEFAHSFFAVLAMGKLTHK
jgi:phospholipase/lecithinase/hemolysin